MLPPPPLHPTFCWLFQHFLLYLTDGLTASNIEMTTADITWTISYVPVQLDFIVYYGTAQDSLDDTSDTVTTTDDTTLDYSVTITGLSAGYTYYYKVVASNTDYSIESDVGELTTEETG